MQKQHISYPMVSDFPKLFVSPKEPPLESPLPQRDTEEETMIYTGSGFSHDSPAGISLEFPSAECETPVKVSVKVMSADYVLPPGYEDMVQVSEMFQITASGPLPAPVIVRIQHCAVVDDNETSLVHVVAHGAPPYKFKPLQFIGRFPKGKAYGEIELTEFSIFAILARILHLKMSLSAHLFYQKEITAANFVVTKDLQPHIQGVKERYSSALLGFEQQISCNYTTRAISLVIPDPIPDRWSVTPTFTPAEVETQAILNYRRGRTPPNVQLEMRWTGSKREEKEKITIKVVAGEVNSSFALHCPKPSKSPSPPPPPPPPPHTHTHTLLQHDN